VLELGTPLKAATWNFGAAGTWNSALAVTWNLEFGEADTAGILEPYSEKSRTRPRIQEFPDKLIS